MKSNAENFSGKELTRLSFPQRGDVILIPPDEIIRLEADSNYTRIYSVGRKPILMAKVLSAYEKMLSPFGFLRTHRSHLINLAYVAKWQPGECVVLSDKSRVDISRRKKREVRICLMNSLTAA